MCYAATWGHNFREPQILILLNFSTLHNVSFSKCHPNDSKIRARTDISAPFSGTFQDQKHQIPGFSITEVMAITFQVQYLQIYHV